MKWLSLIFLCAVAAAQCSPSTANLGLATPAYNASGWNTCLNTNFTVLDNYLSGVSILPAFKAAGLTLSGTGLTTNTANVTGNLTVGGTFSVASLSLSGTLGVTGLATFSGGISAGATTNATLTGVSNGNNVTLLNYQKSASALVGNASDQVVYTYTLPGNTIVAGKGIRITYVFAHTTGSASVTTKINFGGTSFGVSANALTSTQVTQVVFMNDPGSHTSNAEYESTTVGTTGGAAFQTSSLDTSAPMVITATFNVANTDQVTPQGWLVELIQ